MTDIQTILALQLKANQQTGALLTITVDHLNQLVAYKTTEVDNLRKENQFQRDTITELKRKLAEYQQRNYNQTILLDAFNASTTPEQQEAAQAKANEAFHTDKDQPKLEPQAGCAQAPDTFTLSSN